uniref:Uncharacterized protein n=1 Tax=Arundo donax TaxID=35708 RepID=A0A0A9GC71_ARUDO
MIPPPPPGPSFAPPPRRQGFLPLPPAPFPLAFA